MRTESPSSSALSGSEPLSEVLLRDRAWRRPDLDNDKPAQSSASGNATGRGWPQFNRQGDDMRWTTAAAQLERATTTVVHALSDLARARPSANVIRSGWRSPRVSGQ